VPQRFRLLFLGAAVLIILAVLLLLPAGCITGETPLETPPRVVAEDPPPIPHALTDHDDCLTCHGDDGIKPSPADHAGRSGDTCLGCHQPLPPATPATTPMPPPPPGVAPQLPTVLERNCQRGDAGAPLEGELATDFTLKDTQGNEFTLSAMLAEKPVVMVFGSFT
jgi:hypothetical protein